MPRKALLIAVDRYTDSEIAALPGCVNDAAFLGRELANAGFEVTTLAQAPTLDKVADALETLGRALKAGDVFLFFFAGHGKELEDHNLLCLLANARRRDFESGQLDHLPPGFLSWKYLWQRAQEWTGVRCLFIFDACRVPLSAPERAAQAALPRAAEPPPVRRRDFPLRRKTPQHEALRQHGSARLLSCQPGEQAQELDQHLGAPHGLFSAALIDVLSAQRQKPQALLCDERFVGEVAERMEHLRHNSAGGQRLVAQSPVLEGQALMLLEAPAQAPSQAPSQAPGNAASRADSPLADKLALQLRLVGQFEMQLASGHWFTPPEACCNFTLLALRQAGLDEVMHAIYLRRFEVAVSSAPTRPEPTVLRPASPSTNPSTPRHLCPLPGMKADQFGTYADLTFKGVVQRFRWIEPGSFLMGSPAKEPERYENEGPQHRVRLTLGFWLADTACTQALWLAVVGGENPSLFKGDMALPVEQVSWDQVNQLFLPRLQALCPAGVQATLPSEAQWEYACRAGTQTAFNFGEQISPEQVNYNGNYPYNGGPNGEDCGKTVPVKALPANSWGLYQMHGNVWEWCLDGMRTYEEAEAVDPLGAVGDGPRAVRGGSWFSYARRACSAFRSQGGRDGRNDCLGFRVALRFKPSQGAEP